MRVKNIMIKSIAVLFAAIFFTACTKDSIRGSGSTLTETRSVAPFTGVQLEGSGDVTVVQGAQQKVEVRGYENLLPIYETYVRNGTLVLRFQDDYNIRNNNISVNIVVPTLAGTGINGSGNFTIRNFNGTSLTTEINGSGDVYTENNTYDNAVLKVNGSGHIRGQQIHAGEADAQINGSGTIDIFCTQKLKATIHGSGEINYWGNPEGVSVDVSGSGSVRKK